MSDGISGLIERIAQGDSTCLDALYEQIGAKLFGICVKMLGQQADAEDALQEVFLKIWKKADRYDPTQDRALAWLCAVTRYHCLDKLRARQKTSDKHDVLDDVPLTSDYCAENDMEGKQIGERLNFCLGKLDPPKGDAVRRAYVEGYSYKELAEAFSVPLNTMRTWLRRGLVTLKSCMQEV